MGKNITLKQLNELSTYDELYPAGAIDYTMLTEPTSAAYGVENGTVKDALTGLYQYIHSSNVVKIKVVDASNNPLPNITANGITGSPQSGTDGVIKGVADSNSVTLVSPYVDTIKTKTVDVSKYKNTTRTLIVTMDSVADGSIIRYTSSQNVMFSNRVANIDVCCVGGGGGGNTGRMAGMSGVGRGAGEGGGGGGIVNSLATTVVYNTNYNISVGSGGNYGLESGGNGGKTSFGNLVTANGGGGASYKHNGHVYVLVSGTAGAIGCGDGGGDVGGSNTTVSEFNDGLIYYSGGGGGALLSLESSNPKNGGKPNGANGAWIYTRSSTRPYPKADANIAGIGGGGGGGIDPTYSSYGGADGSSGGPGLVAIRIHLKS